MSLVSSVFLMCLDTQVLVFGDCAIIPNPSPKELAEIAITSEKYQIRRYGFHGTSHHYVAKEAAKFLNIPYEEFNAISLHLGNGSSVAAIQKGKSVDTSMGLTPLEGLIMGTRCGDIDPTVVEYTAQCANKSLEEVMKMLNHESGLKGICGDNEKYRSQKAKRR